MIPFDKSIVCFLFCDKRSETPKISHVMLIFLKYSLPNMKPIRFRRPYTIFYPPRLLLLCIQQPGIGD